MSTSPILSRKTREALAELTGFDVAAIADGWRAAREGRYESWTVPKGDGRRRAIESPAPELKRVQSRLLERVLYRATVSPFAHGFVPGRSVVTNARAHLDTARHLVSLDLEDAFPSVRESRVFRTIEWSLGPFFASAFPTWPRESRRELCEVIAALACHRGSLPQGAPTSGAILNLVCARLDRLIVKLLRSDEEHYPHLRYSRYADDLTFTSAIGFSPDFVDKAIDVVRRSGFRVNRRKIRKTDVRHGDLVICGVRLHEGELTLERRVLRDYRALFHNVASRDPAAVTQQERDLVHGVLGRLTMVTRECPKLLAAPLQRLARRHGAWLRPRRGSEDRVPFPRYGW